MNATNHEPAATIEALRLAYRNLSESAVSSADCPTPERIWAAVGAELPPEERHELVDHITFCAACAESWRLAHSLRKDERACDSATPGRVLDGPWHRRLAPFLAAAAASALLVVGVQLVQQPNDPAPIYRQGEGETIQSLVPEEEPLPRDRFVLRWTAGPEGSLYDLRVSTEDLESLPAVYGLTESEYQIPTEELSGLPSGTRLLWQVETVYDEGLRIESPTFLSILE